MNYEQAADRYMETRREMEAIDREYKEKKAAIKQKMVTLENWFTAKAQEDGLESIKTGAGTAYWSTHSSAKVASREDLFNFCMEHNAWDLIESRASKTAVRSYIEAEGAPPPGVDFSSVSVFNFRKA
jgi:hypothetical protein